VDGHVVPGLTVKSVGSAEEMEALVAVARNRRHSAACFLDRIFSAQCPLISTNLFKNNEKQALPRSTVPFLGRC
jgi:hypothetical protein